MNAKFFLLIKSNHNDTANYWNKSSSSLTMERRHRDRSDRPTDRYIIPRKVFLQQAGEKSSPVVLAWNRYRQNERPDQKRNRKKLNRPLVFFLFRRPAQKTARGRSNLALCRHFVSAFWSGWFRAPRGPGLSKSAARWPRQEKHLSAVETATSRSTRRVMAPGEQR